MTRNEVLGERVVLCETTPSDLPALVALWNDGGVMRHVGFPNGLGMTEETAAEWLESVQANPRRHHFVVHVAAIGFCGEAYYAVEPEAGRAQLDIKFRPEAQGRGLATDALRTLIGLVFRAEPGVAAVYTGPTAENVAAQRLYQRCGLRPTRVPDDLSDWPSYWELRR